MGLLNFIFGRQNGSENNKKKQERSPRANLRFETLEQRELLANGGILDPGPYHGTVIPGQASSFVIDLTTSTQKEAVVKIDITRDSGLLDPAPVALFQITDSGKVRVPDSQFYVKYDGTSYSSVTVGLAPGKYQVQVEGDLASYGGYICDVFLPGADPNGTDPHVVGMYSSILLEAAYKQINGTITVGDIQYYNMIPGYSANVFGTHPYLDANHNGKIDIDGPASDATLLSLNQAAGTVNVTLVPDTDAPTFGFSLRDSYLEGGVLKSENPVADVQVYDQSDITSFRVSFDGVNWTTFPGRPVNKLYTLSESFLNTVPNSPVQNNIVKPGGYTLYVEATDSYGNTGTNSFSYQIVAPLAAPIANPVTVPNASDVANTSIDVLAECRDPNMSPSTDTTYLSITGVSDVIVPGTLGTPSAAAILAALSIPEGGKSIQFNPGHLFDYLDTGAEFTFSFTYTILRDGGEYASNTVEVTVVGTYSQPVAPSGLQASNILAEQLTLNWTAPTVDADKITGYLYRYSSDNGQTWSNAFPTNSTNTLYTVGGLTHNTPYLFQVATLNPKGQSDWSSPATATTLDFAPNAPASAPTVSGTIPPTASAITIDWVASVVDQNHGAPTEYIVEYTLATNTNWNSSSPIYTQSGITGTSTTIDTNLQSGTEYIFRVRAVNNGGTSTASPVSAPISTESVVPNAPVMQEVSGVQANQVTVNWTWTLGTGGTVSEFQVQYREVTTPASVWTTFPTSAVPTARALIVTGLDPNTEYEFQVVAVGSGSAGNAISATTETATTLLATPILQLKSAPNCKKTTGVYDYSFSWTADPAATFYQFNGTVLDLANPPAGLTLLGGVYTYSLTDPGQGSPVSVNYTLQAFIGDPSDLVNPPSNHSAISTAVPVTIPATPTLTAPTIDFVQDSQSPTGCEISWMQADVYATGYEVQYYDNDPLVDDWVTIPSTGPGIIATIIGDDTSGYTAVIVGLDGDLAYQFRVVATATNLTDAESNELVLPALPTESIPTATGKTETEIDIEFDIADDTDKYMVQWMPATETDWDTATNSGWLTGTGTQLPYTIDSLTSGTTYKIRIVTGNERGETEGTPITETTAVSITLAAPVISLSYDPADPTALFLGFVPVANATDYLVYYRASDNPNSFSDDFAVYTDLDYHAVSGYLTLQLNNTDPDLYYQFKVVATANGLADSDYSNVVSAIALPAQPAQPIVLTPGKANALTVDVSGYAAGIELVWQANLPGAPEMRHMLTPTDIAAGTFEITGLIANQEYAVLVQTSNQRGTIASDITTASTLFAPATRVTIDGTSSQINWVVPDGASSFTYDVYIKGQSDTDYSEIGSGLTTPTCLADNLTTGGTYDVYYVVYEDGNLVGPSEVMSFTQAATAAVPGATAAPTMIDRTASTLRIEWVAPDDGGASPVTYTVQVKISGTWYDVDQATLDFLVSGATISLNGTTASFTGLPDNEEFEVRIKAANIVGDNLEGDRASASFRTLLESPVPTVGTPVWNDGDGVTITSRHYDVPVDWARVWGAAEGYTIEWYDAANDSWVLYENLADTDYDTMVSQPANTSELYRIKALSDPLNANDSEWVEFSVATPASPYPVFTNKGIAFVPGSADDYQVSSDIVPGLDADSTSLWRWTGEGDPDGADLTDLKEALRIDPTMTEFEDWIYIPIVNGHISEIFSAETDPREIWYAAVSIQDGEPGVTPNFGFLTIQSVTIPAEGLVAPTFDGIPTATPLPGGNSVQVDWALASDSEPTSGFYVYYSANAGTTWHRASGLLDAAETSFVVDGLNSNTNYTFKVEALSSPLGKSTMSEEVIALTTLATPTLQQVGLPVWNDTDQTCDVTFTWKAIPGASGYELAFDDGMTPGSIILDVSDLGNLPAGLSYNSATQTFTYIAQQVPGSTVAYTLTALSADNISAPSVPVTVAIGETTAPSAPTDFVSTGRTAGTVSFSWTASLDSGTKIDGSVAAITGYAIYFSETDDFGTATHGRTQTDLTDLTLTVGGLDSNTTYYFWIIAVSDAEYDNTSLPAPCDDSVLTMLETPVFDEPIQSWNVLNFGEDVTLSWSAVPGADYYELWINDVNDVDGWVSFDIGNRTSIPYVLHAGSEFEFKVVAHTLSGNISAESNIETVTVAPIREADPASIDIAMSGDGLPFTYNVTATAADSTDTVNLYKWTVGGTTPSEEDLDTLAQILRGTGPAGTDLSGLGWVLCDNGTDAVDLNDGESAYYVAVSFVENFVAGKDEVALNVEEVVGTHLLTPNNDTYTFNPTGRTGILEIPSSYFFSLNGNPSWDFGIFAIEGDGTPLTPEERDALAFAFSYDESTGNFTLNLDQTIDGGGTVGDFLANYSGTVSIVLDITAENGASQSLTLSIVSDAAVLDQPNGLVLMPTGDPERATLSWDPVDNADGYVVNYRIRNADGTYDDWLPLNSLLGGAGGDVDLTNPSTPFVDIYQLYITDAVYEFQVIATDSTGTKHTSTPSDSIELPALFVPEAPIVTIVENDPSSAKVDLSDVGSKTLWIVYNGQPEQEIDLANDGDVTIDGDQIAWEIVDDVLTLTGLDGAKPFELYFQESNLRGDGIGESAEFPALPSAVQNLALDSVYSNIVTISFDVPLDATGYMVAWKLASGDWNDPNDILGVASFDGNGDGLTFETWLDTDTEYAFIVVSVNERGETTPGTDLSVTTEGPLFAQITGADLSVNDGAAAYDIALTVADGFDASETTVWRFLGGEPSELDISDLQGHLAQHPGSTEIPTNPNWVLVSGTDTIAPMDDLQEVWYVAVSINATDDWPYAGEPYMVNVPALDPGTLSGDDVALGENVVLTFSEAVPAGAYLLGSQDGGVIWGGFPLTTPGITVLDDTITINTALVSQSEGYFQFRLVIPGAQLSDPETITAPVEITVGGFTPIEASVPDEPSFGVSEPTDETILVKWDAPTDPGTVYGGGAATISGYLLEWSTDSGFAEVMGQINLPGTSHQYALSGLDPNMTYYFRLTASNATGDSPYVETAITTLYAGPEFDEPMITPTADGSTYEVELSWTAVPGATSYTVQLWDNATKSWGGDFIVPTNEALLLLAPSTGQAYRVIANDNFEAISVPSDGIFVETAAGVPSLSAVESDWVGGQLPVELFANSGDPADSVSIWRWNGTTGGSEAAALAALLGSEGNLTAAAAAGWSRVSTGGYASLVLNPGTYHYAVLETGENNWGVMTFAVSEMTTIDAVLPTEPVLKESGSHWQLSDTPSETAYVSTIRVVPSQENSDLGLWVCLNGSADTRLLELKAALEANSNEIVVGNNVWFKLGAGNDALLKMAYNVEIVKAGDSYTFAAGNAQGGFGILIGGSVRLAAVEIVNGEVILSSESEFTMFVVPGDVPSWPGSMPQWDGSNPIVNNGDSVVLNWDAVVGVDSYLIEYVEGDGSDWTGSQTVSTIWPSDTVSGLLPEAEYSFRIIAVSNTLAGAPVYSVASSVQTRPPV